MLMTKPKDFEHKLVAKNLISRWSVTRGEKIFSKTLTLPKRFVDEWQADKTLLTDEVVIIPLGEPNSRLGILVVPKQSPLLVMKKDLHTEIFYLESRLKNLYDNTLTYIYDALRENKKKTNMDDADINKALEYLEAINFDGEKGDVPDREYDFPEIKKPKKKPKKKP